VTADLPDDVTTRLGAPSLHVTGLDKRFGSVVTARDVSFEVGAGEVLGIVGPNGAGKTTLLDIVSGTVGADAGAVLLEGTDVSGLAAPERARLGIGRTYQTPRPFTGMSVFENALVGARFAGGQRGRAAYDLAYAALETAGLAGQADAEAGSLRLLDRKRLELARALATSPRVVLLDEIAGGLTDQELPQLIETIRGLRDAGLAVVWIEHIVHALLQVVDRLMCLALGDVVAVGDPHEVLRHHKVVDVYLGADPDVTEGSAS
jgi:branched-chain amino acid transport system ATP-binding protein